VTRRRKEKSLQNELSTTEDTEDAEEFLVFSSVSSVVAGLIRDA
jgi:hypothetical protein